MTRWPLLVLPIAAIGAVSFGQVLRDRLPVLDQLPAWAGGRPDVVACERTIPGAVSSGYRRMAVERVDSLPLTQQQFDREAGIVAPAAPGLGKGSNAVLATRRRIATMQAQLDHDRAVGHELRLRRMRIDYVADGVPLFALCQFRLIDGTPTPADRPLG